MWPGFDSRLDANCGLSFLFLCSESFFPGYPVSPVFNLHYKPTLNLICSFADLWGTVSHRIRWPTRDTLQTKKMRCKQKTIAANKKGALQTKNGRCKQKRCAANKKRSLQTKKKNRCNSNHARAPCVGVIWFYAPVGSRTFPRNVLFMFSMFCSSCGSQLAKAAKFCQVCGITISVKEEDLSCVAQLEVEPSERKRHQTALLTF